MLESHCSRPAPAVLCRATVSHVSLPGSCVQDAEEFAKKCNDSGGKFELFVYDDAGHAFLTAESHRESEWSLCNL